jgi:hypothetical protein
MSQPPAREPEDATAASRPQVLFVMGSGHSGSTILGVALGNCSDFVYAGELDNWLTRSGVSVLGGLERTRFWSAVRERVDGAEELFGTAAQSTLERSGTALRPGRWGQARTLRPRWQQVTEQLYRAIAEVSGAGNIVDTSHFPLRARELKALSGIDVRLVFLVRDPDEVVGSFTRFMNRHAVAERTMRVLSKNLDIWITHVLSLAVFLRTPHERRLLLRHEDFLADPEGVLRELLAFAGSEAPLPDLGSLRTGFPIQANRLIHTETVALQSKPPRAPRLSLTRLLQLPFELVFERIGPRVERTRAHG